MKNKLLLLLLLLSAWGARAQRTTLAQESFETNGEGTRYVSNSFDGRTSAASVAGAFPYFTRALTNPLVNPFNPAYVSFGSNMYPVTIGNVTGSVFWAAEAVESASTNPASTDRPPGVVTLTAINASNYSDLRLTVALADARGPSSPIITQGGTNPQYEANDVIRLQYSTDGGANYTTIGQFLGNNSTGNGTGFMQLDANGDGAITSADGAQSATNTLDINLRDFSFNIPGSPGALLVRVQIDQRGASEELAFDNIRVTGVLNTVAPPVLANIEGSAVSYAEGQPATQITSALTVTNAAGNLTGATVTLSSGRVAGQDALIFVNQPGITGSFNTSTGVLTLTGSASAAAYQTALRSVAYQNTNSVNATAGTRTIQFVVANGSTTSGVASRNVVVTSALNAATTLPYREDFTTDGEGTRYASNTFSNSGTGAAWLRTNVNPYQTSATSQSPTTFSGISNSFYWYGNNTNSVVNPSRVGTLQTLPINTAGYANLNFSLLLGASSGANASWQTADYFRVSYRQVGTNTWISLIQFRGSSAVVAGQGNLQRDADPNTAPGSAAPTGTALTPALASFSAALPSSAYGQTLEFQLVQVSDDIRAELAFDNLQLTGTVLTAPTVATTAPGSVTGTSAFLGGSVTADGGASVTERGVVYVVGTGLPTTSDSKVQNGSGIGSYGNLVSGLRGNTTYTVRAYAINSAGTAYGNSQTFTTPNNPPTANADAATVAEDSGPTVIAVLSNDTSVPDINETLTVTAVTQPANGTVTINGGTTVSFAPALNFNGTTSFTYTIADGNGGTATATVTVTVTPVNDAPVVTTTAGSTTYTPGAGAVAVDNGLTVMDVDNTTLASATVSIGAGFVSGQDALSVTVNSGVTGTYTFSTGVLMLTGTATVAQYQAILRSVTYNNTSASPNTATRTLSFTVNDGSLTSAVATKNVTFAATTTLVSIVPNGPSPTSASTVAYTVTFANPVTGLSAANFATITSNLTGFGVAPVTGSGTTYIVTVNTGTVTNPSFPSSVQIQFNNSVGISPVVTNTGFNSPVYVIDRTAPTATINSSAGASGGSTATAPIPFTVTFSESVTGFSVAGLTVSNGTVTTGSFSGSGTTYTFSVAPAASGPVAVSVPAGAAQDAAGNGSAASATYSLSYSPPISVAPTLLSPTNGATTPGVLIIGGSAPTGSFVGITVTNTSTGVSVSRSTSAAGNNSFSSQFTLASGTYQAVATAQQSGSQPASSAPVTFTVDATPPTATITSTAGSPTSTAPIPVTVSFSEAVSGFAASSVSVTNGTITSAITNVGNEYSFSVTPTASGVVTVSLLANAVRDVVGNYNVSASQLSVTYAAPITATTWTGTISPDWYTAANWSAGVPTATVDALVPAGTIFAPLITAGTAEAKNLTLGSGATLSQSGGTLRLTGDLTNNGTLAATGGTVATSGSAAQTLGGSSLLPFWSLNIGAAGAALGTSTSFQRVLALTGNLTTNGQPLTLLSRVSGGTAQDGLVVNNGGVVVGTATVQRAIDPSVNPGAGYRHYSAPVSNTTVADLTTPGFTPTVNPAYNTSATPALVTPFPTVFGYDDSRLMLTNNLPAFDKGYFSPATLADPLAVGRGYAVNISASEVVDFQGTLNYGDRTLSLTSTRNAYPDGGWQFLGNPYPAPLDYSRVAAADRLGLESAIYVYSSTSQYQGRYRAYINGIGNPVLPIGQGFFARVASGQSTATMTFRNSQRLTVPNGTTFQRTAADQRPLVQLALQGVGTALADEVYVYFEPGAGSGFEPAFDAQKLPNATGLNLSTRLADGQALSIDGQPELGTSQRVVPLAVGVPTPGVYSFGASQLLNLGAVPVYLRDRELNTLTDLRQQPSYQFTVANAAALSVSRFELVFSPQQVLASVPAALAQQVALYPNPARTQVAIELPAGLSRQPVTATLLDALGRVVRQQVLPAGGATHTLPLAEVASGVYSLRLATELGTVVRKLVVE